MDKKSHQSAKLSDLHADNPFKTIIINACEF
jgi:hypothetical protein